MIYLGFALFNQKVIIAGGTGLQQFLLRALDGTLSEHLTRVVHLDNKKGEKNPSTKFGSAPNIYLLKKYKS